MSFLKKKVTIFGRAIPVTTAMLLLTVLTVFAWALWLVINMSFSGTITVKDAPSAPMYSVREPVICEVTGAGIATQVSEGPGGVVCNFSGIDESSVGSVGLDLGSSEPTADLCVSNPTVDPIPGLIVFANVSGNTIAPDGIVTVAAGFTADGDLMSHGGETLAPFSVHWSVDRVENHGGICP